MIILGFPSEIGIQKALMDLLDPRFLHYAGNILAGFCTVQDFAERLARLRSFIRVISPTCSSDVPAIVDRLLGSDSPHGEVVKIAFAQLSN